MAAPWKELLKYYQTREDVRLRYGLLVEKFQPAGMLEERLQVEEPEKIPVLSGDVIATNLDLREEADGTMSFVGGASFKFKLAQRVAVLGKGASGTDRLAIVMAGVDRPLSGSLSIGDLQLTQAPESITGRRIAYVGQEPRLRSGSVRDNLLYSLKHRPLRAAVYDEQTRAQRERVLAESAVTGNSSHDINADWVDYEAAGVTDEEALTDRIMAVLTKVDLDEDVYHLGLRGTVDPQTQADLAARVLEARKVLRDRLKDPAIAPLVELFDRDRFNTNMTIAENLLFGTPCDKDFEVDNLSANSYVRKVLQDTRLMPDFIDMGRKIAAIMVDLFADVAPGSELFEQYSFIHAEDLPVFQSMLARTEGVRHEDLSPADLNMLLSLPFKLIPARHRLGLCDEPMQARLLEARHAIAAGLEKGAQVVEFFDPERYNSAISIQDNILFGRLAYGKARSAAEIGALIGEVVEKLNLRRIVMEVGLDYSVGIAGSRLNGAQRQKLAIARAVLKRPDLIVLDRATATLDPASQDKIMRNLFEEFQRRGLIWMLHRAELGSKFEHALVLESGKVVEQGQFTELNRPGTVLQQLVATG